MVSPPPEGAAGFYRAFVGGRAVLILLSTLTGAAAR